jgi:hypothetical protein
MYEDVVACVFNLWCWRRNIDRGRSMVAWAINFPCAVITAMLTVYFWFDLRRLL